MLKKVCIIYMKNIIKCFAPPPQTCKTVPYLIQYSIVDFDTTQGYLLSHTVLYSLSFPLATLLFSNNAIFITSVTETIPLTK